MKLLNIIKKSYFVTITNVILFIKTIQKSYTYTISMLKKYGLIMFCNVSSLAVIPLFLFILSIKSTKSVVSGLILVAFFVLLTAGIYSTILREMSLGKIQFEEYRNDILNIKKSRQIMLSMSIIIAFFIGYLLKNVNFCSYILSL